MNIHDCGTLGVALAVAIGAGVGTAVVRGLGCLLHSLANRFIAWRLDGGVTRLRARVRRWFPIPKPPEAGWTWTLEGGRSTAVGRWHNPKVGYIDLYPGGKYQWSHRYGGYGTCDTLGGALSALHARGAEREHNAHEELKRDYERLLKRNCELGEEHQELKRKLDILTRPIPLIPKRARRARRRS